MSEIMLKKEYDLFIWGCTGYTGKLIADLILKTYKPPCDLNYCFGARDAKRVDEFKRMLLRILVSLNVENPEEKLLTIDFYVCSDVMELNEILRRSKVCLNVSGPYTECGEDVIVGCIDNSTHYVDVTGEIFWVKEMQKKYGLEATSKNIKLVACSGYFSAFIDLGLLYLQDFATSTCGIPCSNVRTIVEQIGYKQEFSDGSINTIYTVTNSLNKETIDNFNDPYAMCNGQLCLSNIDHIKRENTIVNCPKYDDGLKTWTSTDIFSTSTSQLIHFSNEEMGYPYGMDFIFSYRQKKTSYFSSLISNISNAVLPHIIPLITLFIKTKNCSGTHISGNGPNVKNLDEIALKYYFFGTTMQGKEYKCTITIPNTEAYLSTAKAALASSLTLLFDQDLLPNRFGISSPSTLLGLKAINHLQDLGVEFSAEALN